MSKTESRNKHLVEQLILRGRLSLGEVVEMLQISAATARRMFVDLEKGGELIRTHGGIMLPAAWGGDYSYDRSAQSASVEKERIGAASARLIGADETVFLDSGITVLRAADHLGRRIRAGKLKNIRVVTNSLACAEVLAEVCEVCLTGGVSRPQRRDLCGPVAEQMISNLTFTTVLVGADGISAADELQATDLQTAALNRLAVTRGRRVLLLADARKFGVSAFVTYARLDARYYTVVSDTRLADDFRRHYAAQGVTCLLA